MESQSPWRRSPLTWLARTREAKRPVHLRRTSANARLTLFEGAHQGNYPAAFDFLRRQVKGRPADWTLPESGRGAVENIAK